MTIIETWIIGTMWFAYIFDVLAMLKANSYESYANPCLEDKSKMFTVCDVLLLLTREIKSELCI